MSHPFTLQGITYSKSFLTCSKTTSDAQCKIWRLEISPKIKFWFKNWDDTWNKYWTHRNLLNTLWKILFCCNENFKIPLALLFCLEIHSCLLVTFLNSSSLQWYEFSLLYQYHGCKTTHIMVFPFASLSFGMVFGGTRSKCLWCVFPGA